MTWATSVLPILSFFLAIRRVAPKGLILMNFEHNHGGPVKEHRQRADNSAIKAMFKLTSVLLESSGQAD
ncbi:hypothetical protein [Planctobacterium marinum]|uniref:hypothetical protein n=1 Tax=Planctobacterium marinum TaxID=1631968 RepID=UPI001E54E4C6|nr:hypothetical protein [Planctobacterium marinum]MCC2605148.1 hypothetical protein [Planctobacterium marinum]